MNLYSVAFSAQREVNNDLVIQVTAGIIIASSDAEAEREGLGGAFAVFPESDGWKNHQVTHAAIPNNLRLHNHRLEWRIIPIDPDTQGE
jgi:hypothetical protein